MSHSLVTPIRDREQVDETFTGPTTTATMTKVTASGLSEATLVEASPVSVAGEKNTAGDNVDNVPESNETIDALAAGLDNISVAARNTAIPTGVTASGLQTARGEGVSSATMLMRRLQSLEDPFVSNATGEDEASEVESLPDTTDAQGAAPEAVTETYPVREDRANLEPSNTTAQGLYGPDACVFVANLAQNHSDENLEYGVIQAFSRFGNVYVKIRRDPSGMPFAFAQFETKENAQAAISQGRGIVIYGRACRTEVAKVNRALYLSKLSGGEVTFQLAREVLSPFGAIEELWYSTPTDREVNRLPEGIWVRFHFFDDCRDALASLRDDGTYRVEQPRKTDMTRANVPACRVQGLSPRRYQQEASQTVHSYNNLAPEHNQHSVFVGNLPVGCHHQDLMQMFVQFGPIVDAQVLYKPRSANPAHLNVFGFVEFAEPYSAQLAVTRGHETFPTYRIEHKESRRGSPIMRGNFTIALPHQGPGSAWLPTFHRSMATPTFPAEVGQQVPFFVPTGTVQTGQAPSVVQHPIHHTVGNNVALYGNGGGAANYAQGAQSYYPTMTPNNGNANGYASGPAQTNHAQYYATQAQAEADSSAVSTDEPSYAWPVASGDNNAGSA